MEEFARQKAWRIELVLASLLDMEDVFVCV